MKRNDDALNRIISRFERAWRAEAKEAIFRLYELLDSGMKVEAAVVQLRKEYLGLFRLSGLEDALIEAAAYGYGIMPEVLVNADRNAIINAVSQPWSADGMTLSEKLHGADRAIHKAIQDTVQQQYNKNATVMEMARTLYDGYQSEVAVVLKPEELPKYMHKVERNLGATREECKDIEKALKNINKLAQNGAPNKALKTAYNELVEAVESGNDKAVQRAVNTALEEKARYIAERIARTESARAYADGFFSKHQDDKDVVAYEIELSTRHPVFDICDMYTQCNMFNLGKGVYPKDKVPIIPLHPHCLCKYKAIIDGKVDMDKMRNQQNQEMVRWVNGLSDLQAKMVLGVQGYGDFKAASKAHNKSNSEISTNTRVKDIADVIRRNMRSYTPLQHPRYRIFDVVLQLHAMRKNEAEVFASHIDSIKPEYKTNGQPTNNYLKRIANAANLSYNINKTGPSRFYYDNGDTIWPPFRGAVNGTQKPLVLQPNTIISRIGFEGGTFASPDGTSRAKRSLPFEKQKETENQGTWEHRYEVLKPLKCIQSEVAPWFDEQGGGLQYEFQDNIRTLIKKGFLRRVK